MALGLVLCGRRELDFDKVGIDLSFEGAWRRWPYRVRFPQVDTDLRHGLDGIWAMTRVDARKQSWSLFWDTSGPTVRILTRGSVTDDDVDGDMVAGHLDGDVPAVGWRELAEDFLARFER